jgi:hypothetical protein
MRTGYVDGFTEQIDVYDYRPAIAATGVWIALGLALDAYLLAKRKNRLISDVLRTKPGRVFLVVFVLHIVNVLGKADPFSFAGSKITARLDRAAQALTDVLPD